MTRQNLIYVTILNFAIMTSVLFVSGCRVYIGPPRSTVFTSDGTTVEKPITLEADNGEFANIYIDSPSNDVPVNVTETGTQVVITARFSGVSDSQITSFANSSSHNITGKDLTLHIGGLNYFCTIASENGVKVVTGVCIEGIKIQTPPNCQTRIFVNGRPAVIQGGMTLEELRRGIKSQSFDSERIPLIRIFADSNGARGRYITVAEVISILSQMTFDDGKLEAAHIFSGHISDRENAYQAARAFDFDSNHAKAIGYLSQ